MLRQSHIFATFRKAKKAALSKGDLFPACLLPCRNALSGVSGKAIPTVVHWSTASTGPQVKAQGNKLKAQGSQRRASERGRSKGVREGGSERGKGLLW